MPPAAAERPPRPRWASSTALIFYALALGAGSALPADAHPAAYEAFHFLSKAFISLIKTLIVPLVFSTIVVGIGKTGDIAQAAHVELSLPVELMMMLGFLTSKGVVGVPRASLVNVMGNCVASVVVARWEGVLEAPFEAAPEAPG